MNHRKKSQRSSMNRLSQDVARLSRLLTRERDRLDNAYLRDPSLRNAYLRYYLPVNFAKIHLPLAELAFHSADFFSRERLRILDLGCGPGTAVLGVLSFFSGNKQKPQLDFTAVDQVAENLREAESLFCEHRTYYSDLATLRTISSDIVEAAARLSGNFDLILLSNVMNELFGVEKSKIGKRTSFLSEILYRLLDGQGSCIVIEPALRETSRDLLFVRDGLLAGGFTIYSPCLIHHPCPALENQKDWCHENVPWEPSETVRELGESAGLRKDTLKFSYIVVRQDGRSLCDVYGKNAFRVVSEPLVTRGKTELFLCGSEGRRLTTRLDKDKTPINAAFGELQRGDIVALEGVIEEERRHRIGKETMVTVLRRMGGQKL